MPPTLRPLRPGLLITLGALLAVQMAIAAEPGPGPAIGPGPATGVLEPVAGSDVRVNQDGSGLPQVETAIAVNPIDPLNLLAAWIDFFVTDPENPDPIGYGWSRDGGRTWRSGQISAPLLRGGTDPAVAADGAGVFYVAFAGRRRDLDTPALTGLLVFRSTDGGESFGPPAVADPVGGETPGMAVDPGTGVLHIVYAGFAGGTSRSAVLYTRSTDRGLTFSSPIEIGPRGAGGILCNVAVGPAGEVYALWKSPQQDLLTFQRSLDGGRTWWRRPAVVARARAPRISWRKTGLYAPLIPPGLTVDNSPGPHRGRIHVVWGDRETADQDIFASRSDDGGATWSPPVRVNDDPPGNLADQFFPRVAADGTGAVHVTFLDRRDDPQGDRYGMTLATSRDGGATFAPNIRISDGIHTPGDFGWIGDYTGLAIAGRTLHAIWPDARAGDLDVYTRAVDLDASAPSPP